MRNGRESELKVKVLVQLTEGPGSPWSRGSSYRMNSNSYRARESLVTIVAEGGSNSNGLNLFPGWL